MEIKDFMKEQRTMVLDTALFCASFCAMLEKSLRDAGNYQTTVTYGEYPTCTGYDKSGLCYIKIEDGDNDPFYLNEWHDDTHIVLSYGNTKITAEMKDSAYYLVDKVKEAYF